MKKLIISIGILKLLIFLSCYAVVNPVLFVEKMDSMVPAQKSRLYADVEFLTTINPSRSSEHPESMAKVAEYIFNEFAKVGGNPRYQNYSIQGIEYSNVIANFGQVDATLLVIGAHYDVCGDQPGADDNASGIAGLLEIARLISEQKPVLEYRIEFVAYANEEPPYFRTDNMGSAVHSQSLMDGKVQVKSMVCLEMIGYFSEKENSQTFPISILKWFYPSKANYIVVVGKLGEGSLVRKVKRRMRSASAIDVRSINGLPSIPGIDFSDHRNYWRHKIPSVMITNTSFYRNDNYHQETDTIDTLDFDKMTEVVKGVYWAIVGLAGS